MPYNLHYFVGKICTVFVDPVANILPADQDYYSQMAAYMVGVVEDITNEGIWLGQVNNRKQKSFWFLSQVKGIAEEKVLDPKKDAEEISKLKEASLTKPKTPPNPYVDPIQMKELAAKFNKQQSTNHIANGT